MRRRTPLLTLAISACAVLVGCGPHPSLPPTPTSAPIATPIPRPTYTVQRGEIVSLLEVEGQVVAVDEQVLFFSTTGKVKEVLVEAGGGVTAGQVLATLDVGDVEEELATARPALEALESDAQRTLRMAELELQIAQLTLDLYKAQGRSALEVQIQELQVELAQLKLDEIQGNIDLQSKRDQVAALEAIIVDSKLVSPVDSQVLSIRVAPGRTVNPNTPILSLGDPTALEVRARLPESELRLLEAGMPVTIIRDDGAGQTLSGTIRWLPSPYESDADSAIYASFDVSPTEVGYQPGDSVVVTVLLERREDVPWLPPQAVGSIAGRTFVIVEEGNTQRRIDIRVGLVTKERVEILEGISAGQVVLEP